MSEEGYDSDDYQSFYNSSQEDQEDQEDNQSETASPSKCPQPDSPDSPALSEQSCRSASEYESSDDETGYSYSPQFEITEETSMISGTPVKERMTLPLLTKYEKANILGKRAMQISKNSPLYTDIGPAELNSMSTLEIAEKELETRSLPFKIRRFFPDGSFEEWTLSELDL